MLMVKKIKQWKKVYAEKSFSHFQPHFQESSRHIHPFVLLRAGD